MIRHACPHCDHEFHSPDELAGRSIQCWNCHKSVEVPRPAPVETATATAVAPRSAIDNEEMDAEGGVWWTVQDFGQRLLRTNLFRRIDSEPGHRGHCMLCGEPGTEVRRCYLRVVGPSYLLLYAFARQTNVQSWVCDRCYRRGIWLNRTRFVLLLLMLALLLFGLLGAIPVAAQLAGSYEMTPEAAKALALGLFIAPMALFIVFPFLAQPWLKRRTRAIVNRDVDARLKELAGVRRWGFFTTILFSHRRRAGEPCVNL
jgi:hypothetical protein